MVLLYATTGYFSPSLAEINCPLIMQIRCYASWLDGSGKAKNNLQDFSMRKQFNNIHSSFQCHIHHFIRHITSGGSGAGSFCRGGFVFQPLCNHLANQLMVWPFWPFRASGRSALPLWSQSTGPNLSAEAVLHFKGVLITPHSLVSPSLYGATLVAVCPSTPFFV